MNTRSFFKAAFVAITLCLSKFAIALDAPAAMVPAGLVPGDTFYIIFVTSTTIAATDANTATYNAHVNAAADLSSVKGTDNASITWRAMVATLNDGAQSTGLFTADASKPIYNLNGDKVADNAGDMFDSNLDNSVSYSESGVDVCGVSDEVWSGMDNSGTAFATRRLGEGNVLIGFCDSSLGTWNFAASPPATDTYRVYAVSPLLTVAAAVTANASGVAW